ncbi:sensor histidine kinase [Paenibacillus sanguinis]|uniref:sensor histidine kinase n=1 Tax=Paenibacillus sanguinis TaxID=225906 RepID=UPI00035F7E15|nr:histidine kinase [Paenibacillus sanguinis]
MLRGWSLNSLQVKLVTGVLILTLPLISMFIVGSHYALGVVRSQVSESYRSMMTLYMNQIDKGLDDVDQYMNVLVGSGLELSAISHATHPDDYYRAKISLFGRLREDIVLYQAIDSFFMYSPKQRDFLPVQSKQADYNESLQVQEYIVRLIKASPNRNGFHSKSWEAHQINGKYYLIHIMRADGVYFGAYQAVDSLMIPLEFIRIGTRGASLFATLDGTPMTNAEIVRDPSVRFLPKEEGYQLSGREVKFLIVGEASQKGDFSLIAVIPDEQILEKLPLFQRLSSFALLLMLFIIPIGLFFLRRVVLLPVEQLLLAMERVQAGDLGTRINRRATADEFIAVYRNFNNMMSRIQELTVNVYQEKLNKQREELQRLQLQINPHFFLNSLNIIYHLAKVKNFELIKEMSQCLIRYFRFMFRSNMTFVRLEDELEHTRNYLRIQELRYPEQLVSTIEVADGMLENLVPPLIIQTFVENTIKHAVTLDNPIQLFVQAYTFIERNDTFMKIVIEDTGNGFDELVLSELNANHSLENENGEHIGVWNVRRRLKLLYGDTAKIEFANRLPHGAAVIITLPLQQMDKSVTEKEAAYVQPVDRR